MKNKTHEVVAPDWRRAFNFSELTFSTVLRSCRWRTVGRRPPRTSDTPSVSFAVVFFVTKNQAVAKCQSILEWVPCLPWRQKAAWHIWLFFFRMTTWHFSVSDLSHLQREIWESYSVLVTAMTCCIHSEARIFSTRHKFQWSFQPCGKKSKKKKERKV